MPHRLAIDSASPNAAADVLVVPIFEEECTGTLETLALPDEVRQRLAAQLQHSVLRKKRDDTAWIVGVAGPWPALLLVHSGLRGEYGAARARAIATIAVRALEGRQRSHAALLLRASLPEAEATAAAEGALLASFHAGTHQATSAPASLIRLTLLAPDGAPAPAIAEAVARGVVIGEATNEARALVNAPGNELTPPAFADRVAALAADTGLSCEVLDETVLQRMGAGAILAVAQGSVQPPRLVIVRYEGAPGVAETLAMVGKGITFDTGGISIKPGADMHRMKEDMGGAAAVFGALHAIARLKPAANVLGVMALAENMPGSRALKPGDVIRALNGKQIEIISTDAEGRLVLADALVASRERGATHVIDLATLTGGIVVALGDVATGVMGAPQEWVDEVLAAGDAADERLWQLPLFPEYRRQIASDIADIKNTGGRAASSITAALFIKEFVDSTPWAHLDIAGTVRNDRDQPAAPRGPTGVGVRTMVELAARFAAQHGR